MDHCKSVDLTSNQLSCLAGAVLPAAFARRKSSCDLHLEEFLCLPDRLSIMVGLGLPSASAACLAVLPAAQCAGGIYEIVAPQPLAARRHLRLVY